MNSKNDFFLSPLIAGLTVDLARQYSQMGADSSNQHSQMEADSARQHSQMGAGSTSP
jgi:hypothetical protein